MTERSWLLKDLARRWSTPAEHHDPEGYPRELEGEFRSNDGRVVRVRPVRPGDVERLKVGFSRLSSEAIYKRFHAHLGSLPDEVYRYLTHIDYQDHLALIALDEDGDAVGVARYYLPDGAELAEAAVVVGDPWQDQGVGGQLMRRLARAAEQRGVKGFQAFVQRENHVMRHIAERSGFRVHATQPDADTLHLWFRFDELI